jgi:hypothetical protein
MGQVNQLWLRLTAPVPPLATAQSQHEIRRVGGELDVRAVRRDRSAGQARILVGSSREVASTPMNSRIASIVVPDAVAKVGSTKSKSARSENVLPVRLPDVAMRASDGTIPAHRPATTGMHSLAPSRGAFTTRGCRRARGSWSVTCSAGFRRVPSNRRPMKAPSGGRLRWSGESCRVLDAFVRQKRAYC